MASQPNKPPSEHRFHITSVPKADNTFMDTTEKAALCPSPSNLSIVTNGVSTTTRGDDEHPFSLFADEEPAKSSNNLVNEFVQSLWSYEGGVAPSSDGIHKQKAHQRTHRAELGTLSGVFLPCVQNIFGVLFFIRMVWIVGTAGWLQALLIAAICCCTTLTTSVSLSAIATNGVVPGGGSYFLISRNLGPEFGGAVGILFFIGNCFAASQYIIGGVEIVFNYFPFARFIAVNNLSEPAMFVSNYRIYGTVILLVLFVCVVIGVRFVSRVAPLWLVCVLFSIFCVYVGVFTSQPKMPVCFVDGKLMRSAWLRENLLSGVQLANKTRVVFNDTTESDICSVCPGGALFNRYCRGFRTVAELEKIVNNSGLQQLSTDCAYRNITELADYCDAAFVRLLVNASSVQSKLAMGPLSLGRFLSNRRSMYAEEAGRLVDAPQTVGSFESGEVVTDGLTTFFILLATFFPSVTGIMAGSNRSGDLKDAQRSIPLGTISAVLVTSIVYLTGPLLMAATVDGSLLRDKFGDSVDKKLVIASLAWPNEWVVLVGALLATVGAGLQTLVGAPRLLQAVAKDGLVPLLSPFMHERRGEPLYAQLLTVAVVEIGILIAKIEEICAILTTFFLMCYAFVNLACALQTLLKAPSWRPRFRFYHWSISIGGFALCAFVGFSTNWHYALAAIVTASVVYKYIEYKGAEKDWGDGLKGLQMNAARFALLKLEDNPPHVKNWRPQLLVLLKPNDDLTGPKYPKMLDFVRQLKYGRGLIILASVLAGRYTERAGHVEQYYKQLKAAAHAKKLDAFVQVLVATPVDQGIDSLLQVCGLGGMRHNTVVVGWPASWEQSASTQRVRTFVDIVRAMKLRRLALIVLRNIGQFHDCYTRLDKGFVDVWWIVHDGGLLVILQFLLKKHKTFAGCTLRVFAVAQLTDDSVGLKRDLQRYFYHLRIKAAIEVVEMAGSDISAYAYERTLRLTDQCDLLAQLKSHVVRFKDEQPESGVAAGDGGVRPEAADVAKAFNEFDAVPLIDSDETQADWRQQFPLAECGPGIPSERDDPEGDVSSPQSVALEHRTGATGIGAGASGWAPGSTPADNCYTFTPCSQAGAALSAQLSRFSSAQRRDYKRMHTAAGLNAKIRQHSSGARLVILNLPAPPRRAAGELSYMHFVQVLSDGVGPTLLVRGGGQEVVTIDS